MIAKVSGYVYSAHCAPEAEVCRAESSEASGSSSQTCNYVGGASQIEAAPMTEQDYRHPYYGLYFQDDWRMLEFTLNAGMRLEYEDGIDHNGHAAAFVSGFANNGQSEYLTDDRVKNVPLSPSFISLLQQENIALIYTANHQLRHLNENNWERRLGFAWQQAITKVQAP